MKLNYISLFTRDNIFTDTANLLNGHTVIKNIGIGNDSYSLILTYMFLTRL